MTLDEESFRKRFRRSPVWRIKRRGLLRNVAIALGNCQEPRAVSVLIEALQDEEALIRAHSVWALGELLGEAVEPVLREHLAGETEDMVLEEINRLTKPPPI